MVHGTMLSHGGAVSVQSTQGRGSNFALYFPAVTAKAGTEEETSPAQNLRGVGLRVLYVDDEEALISLAKRMLTRLGHKVSGFTDPMGALAEFREHPEDYDVVVTDLSMPHMSGFELARGVLAVRPDMPLLMTSGRIRAEDELHAREAGILKLMLKPVSMHELANALSQLHGSGESSGMRSA